jgi:hypothetical protein
MGIIGYKILQKMFVLRERKGNEFEEKHTIKSLKLKNNANYI